MIYAKSHVPCNGDETAPTIRLHPLTLRRRFASQHVSHLLSFKL
jgi:hypothetical protein